METKKYPKASTFMGDRFTSARRLLQVDFPIPMGNDNFECDHL